MQIIKKILDAFDTKTITAYNYKDVLRSYLYDGTAATIMYNAADLDAAIYAATELSTPYNLAQISICPSSVHVLLEYVRNMDEYIQKDEHHRHIMALRLSAGWLLNHLAPRHYEHITVKLVEALSKCESARQRANVRELINYVYLLSPDKITFTKRMIKGLAAEALVDLKPSYIYNYSEEQGKALGKALAQDLIAIGNTVAEIGWFARSVARIDTITPMSDASAATAILSLIDDSDNDNITMSCLIAAAGIDIGPVIRASAVNKFKGVKTQTVIELAKSGILSTEEINVAIVKRTSPGATIRLLHAILKGVLKGDTSTLAPKTREAILSRLNYIAMDQMAGKELPWGVDKLYSEVLQAFDYENKN